MQGKKEHGFTSVDRQDDPSVWVRVLDKLRVEPFYTAYKTRVRELLKIGDGRWYLDVGAGTGDDALAIRSSANCTAIALDSSLTMATVCCTRSGLPTVVADAGDLPFRDESFDGVRADRTFQHLTNPGRAIAEIVRVSRPGARIVTVDPDYDTQVMEFPDQALARAVLRYRADHGLRNGKLAHQMAGLFRDVGLRAVEVEALTLTVRDPASVDNVMGLKTWARTAALNGYIATEQADVWEKLFDQTVLAGTFFYALTFFITIGVK